MKQNNNTPTKNNFQSDSAQPRRSLLDLPKLSRHPNRTPFRMPDFDRAEAKTAVVVCVGCGGRLDVSDPIQTTFTGCRRCISIYGRLTAAFDENSERKRRELLEKMIGGVSR